MTSSQANTPANSTLEKSNQNSQSNSIVTNSSSTKGATTVATAAPTATTTATVKEEPTDLLLGNCLVNMKKEDHFSPSMSPVGFGSIGTTDRSVTPGEFIKINEKPKLNVLFL